ncbi:MAG: M42 family metallopeptidase [Planctomycetes bacterium]|nr:M42 family metallopeptidase [Planctomycetota bacterium]
MTFQRSESETIQLLRKLTLAPGAPGAEEGVREIVHGHLKELASAAISFDRLGSIVVEKRGLADQPRVLLDAHLDEVAFMVQSVADDGTLSFVPLGGWWEHVLLAQRVDIITERGLVPGVVGSKPPHFLTSEERNKVLSLERMHIDVGAESLQQAQEFGVQVGDPIVPHAEFIPMANPRLLSSKAFDDRAGVALLVESLLELNGLSHPNTVIGVGAVQEEVGCRGAGTAAKLARPDVGIILEGAPADDTPGFTASARQAVLGKGPQIRFADPTAISNRALVRWTQEVARRHQIPVQLAVRKTGGTDAKSIHLHEQGVPTVVIAVPARYIHTHVSLIHLDDFLAARRLVVELVRSLEASAVAALTPR